MNEINQMNENETPETDGIKYRLLKPGERIHKNDEGLHEDDGEWHEVGWLFSACDYVPELMVPIRRKIDPLNA